MTYGRLVASSTVAALLWPWLMVLVTAAHVALEHDHGLPGHDVADRVAIALHGHDHPLGTEPHEHNAVPAEGKFRDMRASPVTAAISPVVTLPAAPQALRWIHSGKRSPPQPPTASPPILRV